MAVTAAEKGTKTAEVGVEHVLLKVAEVGTYTFHVDTNAMAAADVLELRVYQVVLHEGTPRVAYKETFSGAQPVDDQIKISVPISNELLDAESLKFTLKQTAGTGRAFPWKVLKYA